MPGERRGSLSSPLAWKRKRTAAATPKPAAEPSVPATPTPTRAGLRSASKPASKPKIAAEETPPPPPPPPPAAEVGAEVAMAKCSGCELEVPKADFSAMQMKKKGKRKCKGCIAAKQ